jgi:hypothetical protein
VEELTCESQQDNLDSNQIHRHEQQFHLVNHKAADINISYQEKVGAQKEINVCFKTAMMMKTCYLSQIFFLQFQTLNACRS